MYLLHPGLGIMEAMICQHFYHPDLGKFVQREVMGCDACQRTKMPTQKYDKLPVKLADETPWNKLCVDIIGPYKIHRKSKEP